MSIVLILVTTHPILDQTISTANKFGIPVRLYRQWLKSNETDDCILISTHMVVYNDIKSGKYSDRLNLITKLIFDEAHHASAETLSYIPINLPNVTHSYGFSASPFEDNTESVVNFSSVTYKDALVISVCGNSIYSKSSEELRKHLNIPSFINVEYDWKHKYSLTDDWHKIRKWILNEDERTKLISNIINMFSEKGYISITHVIELEYVSRIVEMCNNPSVVEWTGGGRVVFLGGNTIETKSIRNRLGKDIFGIVGTSHLIEGLDLDVPISVTILAEGKSSRQVVQKSGRAVRPGGKPSFIINLNDKGISVLSRHSRERAKVILEEFNSDQHTAESLEELGTIVDMMEKRND